jgi:hypothetical protein
MALSTTLPIPNNTTVDIYHGGNAPPAAPDVAGVKVYLQERFRNIKQAPAAVLPYTHMCYLPPGTDVRDAYNGGNADHFYVPDKNGTNFTVQFVARVGRGTPTDMKIVYLNRIGITWPTDNV